MYMLLFSINSADDHDCICQKNSYKLHLKILILFFFYLLPNTLIFTHKSWKLLASNYMNPKTFEQSLTSIS
jgi:hypothetical protein